MTKLAVIVAAGLGSRLGERTANYPKGFLELDGKPIIEHSIEKLLESGIEKVIIGTGYKHEQYEALASKFPQITCVFNPIYELSGSMRTLYLCEKQITEDFLLLESDLIYEKKAIQMILKSEERNVILASEFTHSGDEVFIEMSVKGKLVNLSKHREELASTNAELMGISKISHSSFRKMCSFAEKEWSNPFKMDYERALVGISETEEFEILKLSDVAWCEIDDESQWNRAFHVIYPIIQSKEALPTFNIPRNILLNPGPATTTKTVKFAQVVADICPREQEFGELMEWISREITQFVASTNDYTTILFGGSGTASVESIISSVIADEGILIINNGAYGRRMCEMAEVYQLPNLIFESSSDSPIDMDRLEKCIQNNINIISHLAVVHNETTTGLLNPIEELGELCKKYNIQLIVDAMSSFAAIPIDMEKMNISYLAASANKNLQGMAGVSFVIARKMDLEKTNHNRPRNLYLHLYSQYRHFKLTKQMRFTPPVQTLYALKQAILETKWEGIENRYARYTEMWQILIEGITNLGLEYIVEKKNHSKIITAIKEPTDPNYDFERMHEFFYENGITIYPGKLENQKTFRVANIGQVNRGDIERFVNLLETYLLTLKGRE